MGWNDLREEIFANQKRLGVIPQDAKLTPWPSRHSKELGRPEPCREEAVQPPSGRFAAYLAYTDHEIGRVVQAVEDMGKLDNTLIIYISGDNGSSAEGSLGGNAKRDRFAQRRRGACRRAAQILRRVGLEPTYPHMAVGWTWAYRARPTHGPSK